MVCRLSHHSRATLSDIQVHIFYPLQIYTIHIITHYTIIHFISIILYNIHIGQYNLVGFVHQF